MDSMYIDIIKQGKWERVLPKLERDYRDLALVEGMQQDYTQLYEARKVVLTELQQMNKPD